MSILLGITITAISLIVLSQGMRFAFSLCLNAQKGSREEVLWGDGNASMKALIVYQPGITGFTHEMAHRIAAGLNDKGYEVTLNHPGTFLSSDISQYALAVFCSPVYSGQPSRALTDYMSAIKTSPSCRIVLISTGGFKYYMELDAMERSLRGAKAYKKVKFITGEGENDMTAYHLGLELSK